MSKKIRLYISVSLFLLYGIINLILFLTIKPEYLATNHFWICWSIAFPANYIAAVGLITYMGCAKKYEDITVPPALLVIGGASVVYVVLNLIFMLSLNANWKTVVILNAIVTVIYIVVLVAMFMATSYINGNAKRQKAKVFYIRDLQNDVDLLISFVSNPELVKRLKNLSEEIRFSDPMSHDSLANIEEELKELVFNMRLAAEENNEEELSKLINQVTAKLKYRNQKCANLK